MDCVLRISVFLWFFIELVSARSYCGTDGYYSYYCNDGYYCCGNGRECCPNESTVNTAAIVGIVIAILFVVSVCVCITCCIVKSQKRPGTLIQPATGGQSIAVVGLQSTHTSYQQQQHGQAYPPPPPTYNSNLPPQLLGPAYPPTSTSYTQQGLSAKQ